MESLWVSGRGDRRGVGSWDGSERVGKWIIIGRRSDVFRRRDKQPVCIPAFKRAKEGERVQSTMRKTRGRFVVFLLPELSGSEKFKNCRVPRHPLRRTAGGSCERTYDMRMTSRLSCSPSLSSHLTIQAIIDFFYARESGYFGLNTRSSNWACGILCD